MKRFNLAVLICILFFSCSHKKHLVYLNDIKKDDVAKLNYNFSNGIEIGDILKVDISTIVPEASSGYNTTKNIISNDLLKVDGYLVENDSTINFPILGKINVVGLTEASVSNLIKKLLINQDHFTNPFVKVKKINSKFTILGEVKNPGTFSNFDNKLNVFQAIGYAGDLLITAKRNQIKLLREENGVRKVYKFSLNSRDLFDKPFYYVKNNDVIIVEPNFSKIKSAGFIGSPSSIASISSLILSITLLLINN